MASYLLVQSKKVYVDRKIKYGLYAVLLTVFGSALLSGNIISSFTGDTGRYAGAISLFCLLIVGIFHSQFSWESFRILLRYYLITVVGIALLGIAQHFEVLELPGDHGVTATFGNQDFFAAFLGVSAPLFFFLAIGASKRVQALLLGSYLLCIYAFYLSGPLQAYFDLAMTLVGIAIFALRKRIPRRKYALNSRTFVGTLGLIIWAEFIFLIPFLGSWIPVLGNDVQMKIRSNFWLAGTRGFFSHPLFGLGPDQYGNHYEQFRTDQDSRDYTQILSNDAHSASVQTLSTLGIAGTVAIIFLTAILIRAFLILWDSKPHMHKELFALALFIFVYLTNAFVSPMTFPSKYLLWAVAGFLIGQVYLYNHGGETSSGVSLRIPVSLILVMTFFVGANFTVAQYKYATAFEKYAANQKVGVDYRFNPFLPCFMYFEGKFNMVKNLGIEKIEALARAQTDANPRCVSSRIILAQIYEGTGDSQRLKEQIYNLVAIAPSRQQVLTIGMKYANQAGDQELLSVLQRELSKRGLVYVPGTEG